MPAPVKAQLLPFVQTAAVQTGFTGEAMGDLSDVIADTVAQALSLFAAQAKVLPGIPAVVAPPPAPPAGSTVGPGMLMPPPAGGPDQSTIQPMAEGLFAAKGFTGENIADLSGVIAQGMAQGIALFAATVKVAPGIPIVGGVTSAPGMLLPPAPPKGQIKPILDAAFAAKGLIGKHAGDLAEIIAEGVAQGLNLFAMQMMVAPGIPAPPPAGPTAAPGMLV